MNQIEIELLDKCIEMILVGASPDDCIKRYPDLPQEVLINLKIASEMFQLGEFTVPADMMSESRKNLLEQAARYRETNEQKSQSQGKYPWFTHLLRGIEIKPSLKLMAGRVIVVLGLTALLIIFSRGLVITSAKSLPGDSLYPIKRAVEDIRVYLTANQTNKQVYEEDYNLERVGEVIKLLELNRVQQISFEGIVEGMTSTQWNVSGIPVNIHSDTTLPSGLGVEGKFVFGMTVEVEGYTNGMGAVDAKEIHLRVYQVKGTVEKIENNSWQISGIKIPINSATKIEGGIVVGDQVVALVQWEDNGLFAASIQTISQVTPLPIIRQTPINTPVPEDATQIYESEHDLPEITISPEPSERPETQDQEEQQEVSEPTSEEEHVATPVPETTHESEHEDSSATPEHHETPVPTDTHEGEP
jgi:hypothetical protein